ncbi:hypothetical protein BGZ80_000282, partial [Entomortierella chlamydospora]
MSAPSRIVRIRALLAHHQPTRNVARPTSFTPNSLRLPIHRPLYHTAAVVSTRAQDRWNPWMVATVTAAGILSWQLGHSIVEAESPAKPNVVVDPDSKIELPVIIRSGDGSPARLLGHGVRKITFLKVQVYVVGLYAKESDLDDHNSRFRALPEVQKFQRTDDTMADAAFRAVVQSPIELILRIVPVRNTNGPHLRDGFTRNLTQAAKEQKLNEPDNEEAMEGIMEFKALFPKGNINANQPMTFRKSPDGSMTILLDGEVLGTLRNKWVIENFFLGYLKGDNPISEKARDSIAQGVQNLLLHDIQLLALLVPPPLLPPAPVGLIGLVGVVENLGEEQLDNGLSPLPETKGLSGDIGADLRISDWSNFGLVDPRKAISVILETKETNVAAAAVM